MFKLSNYGGTLYKDSTAILKFKYCDDSLAYAQIMDLEPSNRPFELRNGVSERMLRLFLENRTTPSSRQGINEDLRKTPMPYYNPEWLLRYSKAHTCDDKFWIEPDSDTSGLALINKEHWKSFIGEG